LHKENKREEVGGTIMFIAYSTKNGKVYARVVQSKWKNGTSRQIVLRNLGLVIDKEKGIYRNRKEGLICYNLEKNEIHPCEPMTLEG